MAFLIAISISCGTASTAHADTIVYTLSGQITSTADFAGTAPGGIDGAQFTMIVAANSAPNYGSATDGYYGLNLGLSSFTLSDGYTYGGIDSGSLQVASTPYDTFNPEIGGIGLPPGTSGTGLPAGYTAVWTANDVLYDVPGNAYSGIALPTSLTIASFPTEAVLQFEVSSVNNSNFDQTIEYELNGTITALSATDITAPEPATGMIIPLALAVGAGAGLRRHRTPR